MFTMHASFPDVAEAEGPLDRVTSFPRVPRERAWRNARMPTGVAG